MGDRGGSARRTLGSVWVLIGFIGCGGESGAGASGAGGSASVGSGASQQACGSFCDGRQQAGCAGTEARADCVTACSDDDIEPGCSAAFSNLVACGASAAMQCGPDGTPRITADCAQTASAYDDCMLNAGYVPLGEPCDVYSCAGICHLALGCVECMENTDCLPTEECTVNNKCRQRCLTDADCPGSFCSSSDVCGDPVGTPCQGYGDCEGGHCIDVDANLMTVDSYCTISCFPPPPCPAGYDCQSNDSPPPCPAGYDCQSSECRRM